jgi:hypothetical protein
LTFSISESQSFVGLLSDRDNGKVSEHDCVPWSPNQEWIFRSIKVKPYFPSKEELNKNPLRPDDKLPFEPQDDAFSPIPYRPPHVANQGQFNYGPPLPSSSKGQKRPAANGKVSGKNQIQIQRPGPIVINPGEPFPPVFPFPILPSVNSAAGKKQESKTPPVPQVRHPGPLPFPAEPVVTDPKKTVAFSPFDSYNVYGNSTNVVEVSKESEEDEEEADENVSDEQSNERDEGSDDERSEELQYAGDQPGPHNEGNGERDEFVQSDVGSEEGDERNSEESHDDRGSNEEERSSDELEPDERIREQKRKEASAGVNYSDYRLHF